MKQKFCILIHFGSGYTAVVAWFGVVDVLRLSTFLGNFR